FTSVVMGKRAGESLADQRAKLAKRQAQLDILESKKKLNRILGNNAHLHEVLLKHCHNLGYHEDADAGATLAEHQAAPRKKAPLAISDAVPIEPAVGLVGQAPAPQKEECATWAKSPTEFLLKRLAACEPVLCAPMAMRAMIPPGKRQRVKSELLKLFEFNTGRDPNGDISEDLQDEAMMDSGLEEDTSRRGHRMARMPLPPDYNKHGVYLWDPKTSTVKHRFTHEEVGLDQKTIDAMGNVSKATIYSNWSEINACLK
ncbi:unnamed protein product, partial [Prorocentrum cordatum]